MTNLKSHNGFWPPAVQLLYNPGCWFSSWEVKELFTKPQAHENKKRKEEKRVRAVNNKLNGLDLRHLIGSSDWITEYHLIIIIIIGDWSMGTSLVTNACLIYHHLLWVSKVCKTPAEASKHKSIKVYVQTFAAFFFPYAANEVWNFLTTSTVKTLNSPRL